MPAVDTNDMERDHLLGLLTELGGKVTIQHICLYVDDIDAAATRLAAAGGTLLSEPGDLPGGDAGPGNRYVYTRTPWGSTIELVTYPSPQAYQTKTELRRWRPPVGGPDDNATQNP